MKKTKKATKWILAIVLLLSTGILLAVRFTNGKITNGEQVIIGYDQTMHRFQFFEKKTFELDGIDGPYIAGNTVYEVNANSQLTKQPLNRTESLQVAVGNAEQDRFLVTLRENYYTEEDSCELPEKIVVLSDIEGNFNGFSAFLISNNITDSSYNWIFGQGHLVLNGDFVDRGENVMAVLWLIYKLEQEALNAGGQLHYILGNHELMNFQGNLSYNKAKYIKVAELISHAPTSGKAVQFLYSSATETGKWLHRKNVIEKIGPYIFVHAGLSPKLLNYKLSVADINEIVSSNADQNLYSKPGSNDTANFLMGREGPFWYRGMVKDYKNYNKITAPELDKILAFYHAEKVIIGHSRVEDITAEFGKRVINIDLKHGQEKYSGKTKGLFIEKGNIYKIDDKGTKVLL
ncbi:MAG: metallophosphoesterase [Chitinophagaceae bacterium]|jgi:hypothetical protein